LTQDLEALQAILQRPCAYQYIGAIGSQKRIRMIYQALQQQGLYLDKLPNFYAPIGLDIGALTPEEIAVSICGELIKVRRGGTGLSLCDRVQHSKSSKVHIGELLYAKLP
jgi:xanthine dehydrogenase accessory factor